MPTQKRPLLYLMMTAASLISATHADAQTSNTQKQETQLPAVVVSADKRGELAETVNHVVHVATQDALNDAQITSTEELGRIFPDLNMSHSGTALFPIISVRGVTSASDFYNPTLSVYVDGVPQLPVSVFQSLLNVEQVEFHKGPQGTLYGKSAQGGILNIATKKPDNTPQMILRSDMSSRNGYLAQGEVSGPLVKDMLYGSASVMMNNNPGEWHSNVANDNHLGDARTASGNAKLRLAPMGSPWELGISGGRECLKAQQDVYVKYDDIGSRVAAVDPNLPEAYRDFYQQRCVNSFSGYGQYQFDIWQLNVTLSTQRLRIERTYPILTYYSDSPEHWKQNTQEVRWSTYGSKEQAQARGWDAVVGLYRQEIDQQRNYIYDMVAPSYMRFYDVNSSNQSESYAAYGDVTWYVTPKFDMSAGVRFTRDHAETDFGGNTYAGALSGARSVSQNTWLARGEVGYQFTSEWRGYANISQGYKPAGYSLAPTSEADANGFSKEESTNYEMGVKYNGDTWRANAAAYLINTKDIQLYSGPVGAQTLKNSGDARSKGIELGAEWDATRQLTLAVNGFMNHAVFREGQYADKDIPFAPKNQISASVKGKVPVMGTMLRPQLTVRRTGAHYFDADNTLKQSAYTLVDATLAWNVTKQLEVAAYVLNLTDKDYRTYGFSYGAAGNYAQVGKGRTVGLTLTYAY